MTNKEKYIEFCKEIYVPIYSKYWWMDAVCGEDNWDVWLYYSGTEVVAAMPYYIEKRNKYRYITKALLSQNNGILFKYPQGMKEIAKQKFEEKVINDACKYIQNMQIDVYEQQYHYSFTNWLPFFWNYYTAITRYTYVINDTSDLDIVWQNISAKCRSIIKKGQTNAKFKDDLNIDIFYQEHEKIFFKQGIECPFSYEQWKKIYTAVDLHDAGKIMYAETDTGKIASLMFLVWDEKSIYQLLAGSIPEYQSLDTYDALIWEGIKYAHKKKLIYDFEGSVIKRISKSFREFGGEAMPYFRIRKIFNEEVLKEEYLQQLNNLENRHITA